MPMKITHIASINFEWELKTNSSLPLSKSFLMHPMFLQFQFLPLLYAQENDSAVVTHFPPKEFDRPIQLHLFSKTSFQKAQLETWGWSKRSKKWADEREITYTPPSASVIREVTSKAFSFIKTPSLMGATIFHCIKEVKKWIRKGLYPKIIKSCFGLAGQERFILKYEKEYPDMEQKIQKAFAEGDPVIGEPWVERCLDFSTQWEITKNQDILFLGTTIMENHPSGTYKRTIAGHAEELFGPRNPFFEEHLEKAQAPPSLIAEKGFYGFLGLDAMIYKHPLKKELRLHPIVEINPRKTMGWLALKLLKKKGHNLIALSYIQTKEEGLLPKKLMMSKDCIILFHKQLKLERITQWKHSKLEAKSH